MNYFRFIPETLRCFEILHRCILGLSNDLHPLLAKGVFPLNGNNNRLQSRFGCQRTVVANIHRGNPLATFECSIHVGFFPHKYVTRSVKLLPVCEVLNIPEASYDRNINKHNKKADKLSATLSFSSQRQKASLNYP